VTIWAGVDVGGRRKGFHAAAVDDERLVAGPVRLHTVADSVEWLVALVPAVVAVDAPRSPAPDGLSSRSCERELARAICGIRYTPDRAKLVANPYYAWILHGLELYDALEAAGLNTVECFPTASWTRWSGARGNESRAAWSQAALNGLGFGAVRGQDARDAIGAALTARCFAHADVQRFGEIVVPRARAAGPATRDRRSEAGSRVRGAAAPAGR
jgi:predicted nuclease with RNAse H fold